MRNLKKYDRYLYLDKKLDGTKIIKRQSPFRATRSFDILTITNQFIGSGLWLFKKLQKMDNQRVDIVTRVAKKNKLLQRKDIKRDLNNIRIHREIADFLTNEII